MNSAKFNEWVKKIKGLRLRLSNMEVDYWELIMQFEEDREAWELGGGSGFISFEEVLHVHKLESPYEYGKFKECVRKLGGVSKVREIGFDAAKEFLKVPDDAFSARKKNKTVIEAVYTELVEFKINHGKGAKGQTAATKVRQHYVVPVQDEPEQESEIDRIRRERREYRKENMELRREIVVLRRENADLRSQLEYQILARAEVIEKIQGFDVRKKRRKTTGAE